jgi:nucleotidyltransferase substrate binding protein (TIGR01987 family)
MGKLKLKSDQLFDALARLEESVANLKNFKKHPSSIAFMEFEFCVDLFWKYVKRYLLEETKQTVEINAPKPVIRAACKAKLISEQDAEKILEMIDDRNKSSHIYKEEIADQISVNTSQYYALMKQYAEKLSP